MTSSLQVSITYPGNTRTRSPGESIEPHAKVNPGSITQEVIVVLSHAGNQLPPMWKPVETG